MTRVLARVALALGTAAAVAAGPFGAGGPVIGTAAFAEEAGAGSADAMPPVRAKAMSEWSDALALQAASWGAPLVIMYNLRDNIALGAKPKAPPGSLWRMTDISTPALSREAGYVTPNVNTLYGFGFLDLGAEPQVLTLPDSHGRFYLVQLVDMWTNAFAYPAGAEKGYGGGRVAIVGPGWTGTLPPGVARIDAPTRWVLMQPRVHLKDEADLAGARAVMDAIEVQSLSAITGGTAPPAPAADYPSPRLADPALPASALDFEDPLAFWDILSRTLNENPPPPDQAAALMPMFAPLGLVLGERWDRAKVDPVVLQAMAKAAEDAGPVLAHLPLGRVAEGWVIPPPTIGDFGTDYLTRAVVARVGLTANTPKEAIYFYLETDSEGRMFSGEKTYTLTFKEMPPFVEPGFWSLTLYDLANNYTIDNPIDRYALGSDDALTRAADGSVTITIQNADPGGDATANWLPAPKGGFYLILRAYAPGEAMIRSLSDPAAYAPPPAVAAP